MLGQSPLYKTTILEWSKLHIYHSKHTQIVREETGVGPNLVVLVCRRCKQFVVIDTLPKGEFKF